MNKNTEKFKQSIIEGNVATVEEFLKKYQHDDIANCPLDDDGKSALHYLASEKFCKNTPNRENLARLLLRYGAKINLKDKEGITPTHEASFNSCTSLIAVFLENAADVTLLTNKNLSVLSSPVLHGELEIVDALLEAGADKVINIKSENGDAAIHGVLENDSDDCSLLKSLIIAGVDLDNRNDEGCTLLHLNVMCYKSEIANNLLLNQGADYLIEDNDRMTALQYAAKESFYPLINGVINAKLFEYCMTSTEEGKKAALCDCVEKFKMFLVENPALLKPIALFEPASPLQDAVNYLSKQWDSIQQELQEMKDKKILDGISRIFKLPTMENLSNIPFSNIAEEGRDKTLKPT